jgi:hypothetical protein
MSLKSSNNCNAMKWMDPKLWKFQTLQKTVYKRMRMQTECKTKDQNYLSTGFGK